MGNFRRPVLARYMRRTQNKGEPIAPGLQTVGRRGPEGAPAPHGGIALWIWAARHSASYCVNRSFVVQLCYQLTAIQWKSYDAGSGLCLSWHLRMLQVSTAAQKRQGVNVPVWAGGSDPCGSRSWREPSHSGGLSWRASALHPAYRVRSCINVPNERGASHAALAAVVDDGTLRDNSPSPPALGDSRSALRRDARRSRIAASGWPRL